MGVTGCFLPGLNNAKAMSVLPWGGLVAVFGVGCCRTWGLRPGSAPCR